MASRMWRTVVRALMAGCFLAGSAAQGAYYSSRWDPASLVVNAVIKVDGCGSSGFVAANLGGGCTASLYSAIATLNSVDGVDLSTPSYIDFIAPTGFYSPGSPAVTDSNADDVILGLFFRPNDLAGIAWNPVFTLGRRAESPNLAGEGPWKLSFLNTPTSSDPWRSIAKLWDCAHPYCLELEDTATLLFQDYGTSNVHFVPLGDVAPTRFSRDGSVIPEPGSLALLAGALGAGWITRRRRAIG